MHLTSSKPETHPTPFGPIRSTQHCGVPADWQDLGADDERGRRCQGLAAHPAIGGPLCVSEAKLPMLRSRSGYSSVVCMVLESLHHQQTYCKDLLRTGQLRTEGFIACVAVDGLFELQYIRAL